MTMLNRSEKAGESRLVGDDGARPWIGLGACIDVAEDWWFPERGEPTAPAKAVCAGCLVRDDCLHYALEFDIRHGVWGGTSPSERKAIRNNRRIAA